MPLRVRPARPEDRAGPGLLYVSAEPYYDAYAGSGRRARRMLERVWARKGHTASYEVTQVAESDGAPVGAIVAFPSEDGDRLARHFLALSVVRLPVYRWPGVVRHLRASATVTPVPPDRALYVDALAVDASMRRRGVATAMLDHVEQMAAQRGLTGVALDTGLQNLDARALYRSLGFEQTAEHRAPSSKVADAVGGPGFVSYFRPLR